MPSTTPTQMRLTEDDKAMADAIRRRFGLESRTAAVRLAIERMYTEECTPAPLSAGFGEKTGS